MEIKILYEDEYILALDKPSGLLVHPAKSADADRGASPDNRSKEKTLTDWIIQNYPELKDVGEEQILQNGETIKRPGIVHRLDKDTSGVILVAKTKEAHQFLKEQFQARKVEKIYHAVVWGKFIERLKKGKIEKFIGRNKSGKWSSDGTLSGKVREAVTDYEVLLQNEKVAYVEVKPKTGRTHQIRVHLKSIGYPVIGDRIYGNKNLESRIQNQGEEIKKPNRLMLHAVSIKLELPSGTHITIESLLPEEFERIKEMLNEV